MSFHPGLCLLAKAGPPGRARPGRAGPRAGQAKRAGRPRRAGGLGRAGPGCPGQAGGLGQARPAKTGWEDDCQGSGSCKRWAPFSYGVPSAPLRRTSAGHVAPWGQSQITQTQLPWERFAHCALKPDVCDTQRVEPLCPAIPSLMGVVVCQSLVKSAHTNKQLKSFVHVPPPRFLLGATLFLERLDPLSRSA